MFFLFINVSLIENKTYLRIARYFFLSLRENWIFFPRNSTNCQSFITHTSQRKCTIIVQIWNTSIAKVSISFTHIRVVLIEKNCFNKAGVFYLLAIASRISFTFTKYGRLVEIEHELWWKREKYIFFFKYVYLFYASIYAIWASFLFLNNLCTATLFFQIKAACDCTAAGWTLLH